MAALYADALEDSRVAAFTLLVVAPSASLTARWLVSRGQKTSPTQAWMFAILVPAVIIALPSCLIYKYGEQSVYRLLDLRRTQTRYVWAQKYAFLRNLYQQGEMPDHIWRQIDTAYDNIYDEKARFLYDYWGPQMAAMTVTESQFNVGLFYLLWFTIIFAVTAPKDCLGARKHSYAGLVAIFCFEMSVRLMHYDPRIKSFFPYTTPREFVLWAHRLFPILVFTIVVINKVYFIDMEAHRQRLLSHMMQQNQETIGKLQEIEQTLLHEDEEELANEE